MDCLKFRSICQKSKRNKILLALSTQQSNSMTRANTKTHAHRQANPHRKFIRIPTSQSKSNRIEIWNRIKIVFKIKWNEKKKSLTYCNCCGATMSELVKSLNMWYLQVAAAEKKRTKTNGMAKMLNCVRRSMNVVAHGIAWHFINESLSLSGFAARSAYSTHETEINWAKVFFGLFWAAVGWRTLVSNFLFFFFCGRRAETKNANSLSLWL